MYCGETRLLGRQTARRLQGICALVLAVLLLTAIEPRPAAAVVTPQYYEIKHLTLPVIRQRGLEGHITIKVLLELHDAKFRPDITAKMVILRDEFIRVLNRYIAHRPRLLLNVKLAEIKALLLKSAVKTIGPGKVKRVLVQAVASRRF